MTIKTIMGTFERDMVTPKYLNWQSYRQQVIDWRLEFQDRQGKMLPQAVLHLYGQVLGFANNIDRRDDIIGLPGGRMVEQILGD